MGFAFLLVLIVMAIVFGNMPVSNDNGHTFLAGAFVMWLLLLIIWLCNYHLNLHWVN